MRDGVARSVPTVLSGLDSDAARLLQHDCRMRHFPLSPQASQAGRAELNSLLCTQQTLHGILQTIREQAGWPAADSCSDDPVGCTYPSTAED